MKKSPNTSGSVKNKVVKNGSTNGFLPYSIRFISSCIKTVSSNVKSAGVSVAGSISGDSSSDDHNKDQVLWACFDRLELSPTSVRRILLIGYSNGFQVLDVEDASNVCELVSRRDDSVTFLQMQPIPAKAVGVEGFRKSHPMLLVVASDDMRDSNPAQNARDGLRDGFIEPPVVNLVNSPTTVRFYSLRSHNYVHILRFRSTVYLVRCSPQIVAVGLAAQIYCFDALTLENKFSVLTYPLPQLGGQGLTGVNIGCGPMAVGPRWLAYASNNPLVSNTGRLSPHSLSPSPGVSPSTSPGNGNLVARYAMESSKQLAAGLINLGDMGYKTLSKYCHELLPDGSSSPVSSNASWKNGRVAGHLVETDAAGMVVVKDFISRAIISQFRAHTSPISALCFDHSGTLLVTASIHGNNINIFRIMPSYSQNGSGTPSYDWSASHVHLYKLHRGMTSAVIQDICFSHYSQWIAIVSSRGTCHIFVLSPFGGETGLQLVNSHANGSTLLPVLSTPWWSTSSFLNTQQSTAQPPVTITLSVVSRIRNGNSGWLNTVSNAASSVAGKISVPSGVVAAVFHSAIRQNVQPTSMNALEHLLVYSPSGHLIQYELFPSLGGEQAESSLRNGSSPLAPVHEDVLRVKVEPVQWWDVCRRADWPEREECINGITLGRREAILPVLGTSSCDDSDTENKEHMKSLDRSHWYLSNAEVQLRSGRIPVWQKSKIYFYTMSLNGYEEQNLSEVLTRGELEVEKIPVSEIEVRRKDLLPVVDHFHRIHPAWGNDRKHVDSRFAAPSIISSNSKEKSEDSVTSEPKSTLIGLADRLHKESSLPVESLHEFDEKGMVSSSPPVDHAVVENDDTRGSTLFLACSPLNKRSFNRISTSSSPESSGNILSYIEESYVVNSPNSPKSSGVTAASGMIPVQPSKGIVTDVRSNSNSNQSNTSMELASEGRVHEDMHSPTGFGQYFREGYCSASNRSESHELTEQVGDVDSNSNPCDKEKPEEDGESDDLLGGVFAFSEEG